MVKYKSKSVRTVVIICLFVCVCFVTIVANAYNSVDLIEISILLTCVLMVLYCLTDFENRLILLLFSICIFTFLVAKVMLGYFTGEREWNFELNNTDIIIAINILISTFLSLIVGFGIGKKKRIKISVQGISRLKLFFEDSSYNLVTVKKINFIIWIVSLFFVIVFNVQKMMYALANGYISLYTSYQSSGFASRFQLIFMASLFIGLAVSSSRRMIWAYITSGLLMSVIILIQGSRGSFVSFLLFIFYYMYVNNIKLTKYRGNKQKPIKLIIIGIIAALIILPYMYAYGHTRANQSYEVSATMLDGVKNFFFEQSNSFSVIKYAIIYKGKFPQKYYSLGSIINAITHTAYTGNTVENALKGRRFGNIVTYTISPTAYLNGFGMGSSYVAEVYYDFGYVGVITVNILLGWLLSRHVFLKKNGVLINSMLFFVLYYLFVIPRSPLLYPINNLFSSSVIVTYVFVFGLAYKRKRTSVLTR